MVKTPQKFICNIKGFDDDQISSLETDAIDVMQLHKHLILNVIDNNEFVYQIFNKETGNLVYEDGKGFYIYRTDVERLNNSTSNESINNT